MALKEAKQGGTCVNKRREINIGPLKGGNEGVYTANCQNNEMIVEKN